MVFTTARGGTERGSMLAVTATTKVWKTNDKYLFLRRQRFMREGPFFREGERGFKKERKEREQRNKKLRKMLKVKVERGI